MVEQYQITAIKKPGGSDNRTTHITEVLVVGPIIPQSLFSPTDPLGLAPFQTTRQLRPRVVEPLSTWRTVESVIYDIEAGKEFFYTDRAGKRAEVMIASLTLFRRPSSKLGQLGVLQQATTGRKYIKTRADSTTVDNLLSLPNHYGQ